MAKKTQKLPEKLAKQLDGKSLEEKVELLTLWGKTGKLTEEEVQYFSNLFQARAHKKTFCEVYGTEKKCKRSRANLNLGAQIRNMQSIAEEPITYYTHNRDAPVENLQLSENEKQLFFECVVRGYKQEPQIIRRLVALGLRLPDKSKQIPKFCADWIIDHEEDRPIPDIVLWGYIWEDVFAPRDAVNLLIETTEDGRRQLKRLYCDKLFLKAIQPRVIIHRDAERKRLEKVLKNGTDGNDVLRKQKRLYAFEELLQLIERQLEA